MRRARQGVSHTPIRPRPLDMTTVSNKATFRRFHDISNSRDLERIAGVIDELVAPDAVIHTPLPIEATGPQLLKAVLTQLRRAFPDIHISGRGRDRGGRQDRRPQPGHRNPPRRIHGDAPTGTRVTYDEIFILRFADGRIAENRGVVDACRR